MARKPTAKSAETDAQFEAMLAASGHVVPPDRRAAVFESYKVFRGHAAAMRAQPISAEVEPANTFSLVPYTKPIAETA